jgi:glycyl-tRNA synthetase
MEMEYFVKPGEDEKAFEYFVKQRMDWYINILGIKEKNLRIRKHDKKELAHYAKSCIDIEYNFPHLGWSEIEGVANRTDFDLSQHEKFSGIDLKYEGYTPYVIEPSCGVERVMLAALCDAYEEVEGGRTTTTEKTKEIEVVLRLDKKLSPIQIAVFPLVKNKENITQKAKEIYELLKKDFNCQYDEIGTVGRRYRRQDEIGTPFAVTIDFEEDVTVRDRDTMQQERVSVPNLIDYFKNKLI